jgi:A/G-specific adenine glycosylase
MRDGDESRAGAALLDWYDRHHRGMPWRMPPAAKAAGERPDPYRVWLSEVMLQQTTVATVRGYYEKFTGLWPTVSDLARAEDADVMAAWAGLGYYARARNLLKCARAVLNDHAGVFPGSAEGLRALPGIGPYTAAAVAAISYDEPAVVVDGNVERVVARLWADETPLPGAKPVFTEYATRLTPAARPGDHAQAMMDLGATICSPRNPACALCPVNDFCAAHAAGIAATLPRKMPKPEKPTRQGIAYLARRRDGAVLIETRPPKGLLGGMPGFPTSGGVGPEIPPPLPAYWQSLGEIRHTFTHFHLILQVMVAEVGNNATPWTGQFVAETGFNAAALPTVMRKVWDLAAAAPAP